jgi:ketosteroid isomerase-like protein
MSQENVEIIKAATEAFNRQDWDAVFKDAAPGAELDFSRAVGPFSGVFKLDQLRPYFEDFAQYWESVSIELHESIEAGGHVIAPMTMHAKGREGVEVAASPTYVWTIRDGAIQRVVMYQERAEALQATGLSEQDAHADSV